MPLTPYDLTPNHPANEEPHPQRWLPVWTYRDILDLAPCFNPADPADQDFDDPRYGDLPLCSEDWQGTALDVLKSPHVAATDKLWLVFHVDWLPESVLRDFADWLNIHIHSDAPMNSSMVMNFIRARAARISLVAADYNLDRAAQIAQLIILVEGYLNAS